MSAAKYSLGVFGDTWDSAQIYPTSRLEKGDPASAEARKRALRWAREALELGDASVVKIVVGRYTRERGWWYRELLVSANGSTRSRPQPCADRRAAV